MILTPEFMGPLVSVLARPKTIWSPRVEKRRRSSRVPLEPQQGRPRTRADCINGPRPCPWVSCKWHLAYDVDPRTGSIKENFPGLELEQLRHTCALDVAEFGGVTLEQVGDVMNVTRERIRQLETAAMAKVAAVPGLGAPEGHRE